jgi:hypothetical protein
MGGGAGRPHAHRRTASLSSLGQDSGSSSRRFSGADGASTRAVGALDRPSLASEKGFAEVHEAAEPGDQRGVPGDPEIGGVRPDALKWHPQGALDVMIPNAQTPAGRALGIGWSSSWWTTTKARCGAHDLAAAHDSARRFLLADGRGAVRSPPTISTTCMWPPSEAGTDERPRNGGAAMPLNYTSMEQVSGWRFLRHRQAVAIARPLGAPGARPSATRPPRCWWGRWPRC